MEKISVKLKIENLVACGLGEALNGTFCTIADTNTGKLLCDGKGMILVSEMETPCYRIPIRDGVLRIHQPWRVDKAFMFGLIDKKSHSKIIFRNKSGVIIFRCPASLVICEDPQIDVCKYLGDYRRLVADGVF